MDYLDILYKIHIPYPRDPKYKNSYIFFVLRGDTPADQLVNRCIQLSIYLRNWADENKLKFLSTNYTAYQSKYVNTVTVNMIGETTENLALFKLTFMWD